MVETHLSVANNVASTMLPPLDAPSLHLYGVLRTDAHEQVASVLLICAPFSFILSWTGNSIPCNRSMRRTVGYVRHIPVGFDIWPFITNPWRANRLTISVPQFAGKRRHVLYSAKKEIETCSSNRSVTNTTPSTTPSQKTRNQIRNACSISKISYVVTYLPSLRSGGSRTYLPINLACWIHQPISRFPPFRNHELRIHQSKNQHLIPINPSPLPPRLPSASLFLLRPSLPPYLSTPLHSPPSLPPTQRFHSNPWPTLFNLPKSINQKVCAHHISPSQRSFLFLSIQGNRKGD